MYVVEIDSDDYYMAVQSCPLINWQILDIVGQGGAGIVNEGPQPIVTGASTFDGLTNTWSNTQVVDLSNILPFERVTFVYQYTKPDMTVCGPYYLSFEK